MSVLKEPRRVIDGIACYTKEVPESHEDYHAVSLDNLYAAENRHFWFITRRERILTTVSRYLSSGCRFLEIGAGTGFIARALQTAGYKVAVGEIHLSGLRYARDKGIMECYQFDLFDPPFENEFDAIGMFDVLEHLKDDEYALRQASKMLVPGGKLFITVPAHQWLWNRDDAIAAHKRRYNRKMLAQAVEVAGLRVLEIRYFFIFILPMLYLRHILNRDREGKVTMSELHTEAHINPIINKVLLLLTRIENRLAGWLPDIAGGSLLCVAERKSERNRTE
jgi:SAM-dependent methyltransferase